MSAVFKTHPSLKNPVPSLFKAIATMFVGIFTFMVAAGEAAGRANAARHLYNMGYKEEAKQLMLRED